MSILIKNGTVVSATGTASADVLVEGEKIAAVAAPGALPDTAADEVIDAAGKYVLPGGIDVHTHLEMPFGGTLLGRYLRDRHDRRRLRRHHHDRGFPRAGQGHVAAGHPR